LEDAAQAYGLGPRRTYWLVVAPDARPVFAAVGTSQAIRLHELFISTGPTEEPASA
jgi:ABC-type glycerol-3-phosphate transport system permease component